MARNKAHSSKFASKRSNKKQGGKVVKKQAPPPSKFAKASSHKGGLEKGNRVKQAQAALSRRKFKVALVNEAKSVGTARGPPRIIGILPLNESGNPQKVNQAIRKVCGETGPVPDTPATIWDRSRRLRMTVMVDPDGNEQNALDMAKVADLMVYVLDCSSAVQATLKDANAEAVVEDYASTYFGDIGLCITDMTRELVQVINAQGSPTPIVLLDGLESYPDPRQRQRTHKIHERYFRSMMCEELVVLPFEDNMENLMRTLQDIKLRTLHWREQRPYLVMEHAAYDEKAKELQFSGYLRGGNLSANQLIHITNHGTFQMKHACVKSDPHPLKPRQHPDEDYVDFPNEKEQESLQETQLNEATFEEDDQAWVMKNVDPPKKKKTVPAGVSEYQAAWYEGDPTLLQDEEDDALPAGKKGKKKTIDVARDENGDGEAEVADDDFDAQTFRTSATEANFLTAADVLRHERMTDEQRAAELQKLRDASADEIRHPDEVDTPFELPARHRFSKYRGLKSFHTSTWDPNENLPSDYARIFKLQGYSKLRESLLRKQDEAPCEAGSYVEIVLKEVPPEVWDHAQNIILASGLLPHEQKWSVVHYQVRRSTEFDEPIKSKTVMLAHIGFRKFYIQPLFSDAVAGDRTKYSRYFHAEETFRMATFYGPISYHPCPIVMFQATSKEEEAEGIPMRLACYGSAAPPNPDKLILKRAVLTGRIATIFRRSLIVKFMFFNDDDVRWFTPVDLYTRLGRRGKIVKPIGTHGLFRATFNEQIMQHDLICMDLWKRVFPKWTTVPYNVADVLEGVFGPPGAAGEHADGEEGGEEEWEDAEEAEEDGGEEEWEDVE